MTSPGKVAGATQDAAGQTASTAKDQAAQVSGAATSAAADVAGTAKEQAGAVAGEAVSQVRGLLDQTKSQVSEQAGTAQQKLGDSLRSITDELRSMGDGSGSGEGPAAELARTLEARGAFADRRREIAALADTISTKQPSELLQDLRTFASRRPGAFLLGALAAGVLAGRLTRGVTAASGDSTPSTPRTPAALPPGDLGAEPYAPIAYQTAEPTPVTGGYADVPVLDDDLAAGPPTTHTGATGTTSSTYSTGQGL